MREDVDRELVERGYGGVQTVDLGGVVTLSGGLPFEPGELELLTQLWDALERSEPARPKAAAS